jgi:molybdopterin synthase sulfur carrier subunit
MAIVYIPAQMRELTGGLTSIEIDEPSVRKIIAALDAKYPGIAARLTCQGGIAPGIAVSIDGAVSSRGMLAQVPATSEVHFLPAIGGG